MQIMLVFEIQIFVHQIQPVDFWFNISYSVGYIVLYLSGHRGTEGSSVLFIVELSFAY